MEQETGMGLGSIAMIAGLFVVGIATMLYFVAPDQARRMAQDTWARFSKQTARSSPPATQPAEALSSLPPTTRPVTEPAPAATPPPLAPPAPPKPKAVLVLNGAKSPARPGQQGWSQSSDGRRTLIMERPRRKPTTRPVETKPAARNEKSNVRTAHNDSTRRTVLRRPETTPTSDYRNVHVAAAGND